MCTDPERAENLVCPRKKEEASMAAVSRQWSKDGGMRRVRNQSGPDCAESSVDSAEDLGVTVGMQRSDQIQNMLRSSTCCWPRCRGQRQEQVLEQEYARLPPSCKTGGGGGLGGYRAVLELCKPHPKDFQNPPLPAFPSESEREELQPPALVLLKKLPAAGGAVGNTADLR